MFGLALALAMVPDAATVHESDRWRFPLTMEQAKRGYEVGKQHYDWLQQHRAWDCGWLDDAWVRWRIYDVLDDCSRIHPLDIPACRRKLAELRRLIGPEAYWRGQLPDYLPTHRFTDR